MKKLFLFFILWIIAGQCPAASFTMTPAYQSAYEELLRLRFDSAIRIIDREKVKSSGNLAHTYLLNYIDFLKAIISEETQDYNRLLDNKSTRLKQLETVDSKSPWRLYAQAQLNLQSGVARVKFGDYAQAAVDINKAYRLFTANDKQFPRFKPNKAGVGLLHVLIGSIPDSYKWVTGILGMEGNVNHGLKELQSLLDIPSANNPYPYLHVESLFITTFITFNLAEDNANKDIIYHSLKNNQINNELKRNPLLIYALSAFYLDQGQNEKALTLLSARPLDKSYYSFHYLDYLTGTALLNKLDKNAKVYFLKYVTHFRGRNFIKSAYQRLAWLYLIEGDYSNYKVYISRIRLFGFKDIDSDKEAQHEAENQQRPNIELLKSRLLFDGGYYAQAEQLLNKLNSSHLIERDHLECLYRQARIYHKSGNILRAKEVYTITYKQGNKSTTYFAANSLLNLGHIYEQEGQRSKALWCFQTCLKLNFNEYRTSIQQKAKAGINRLK